MSLLEGYAYGHLEDRGIVPEEAVQLYRKGRLIWAVDERDRVFVEVNGKKTALGWNHSRAWRGVMTPYSPYRNPEDYTIYTEAEQERIRNIVARRRPLPEPPLPIED